MSPCPPMTPDKLPQYPRQKFKSNDLSIELYCRGTREYAKLSYPVKYGLFSRLQTPEVEFEFNLNHEITHGRSRRDTWLHPSEWLKRTMGNDWIYYSSGGYAGVFEAIGEYYLPNLSYPTNSLLGGKPFAEPEVDRICSEWPDILERLPHGLPGMPGWAREWMAAIKKVTPEALEAKADSLFRIPGARVSVLPPDARHSDYDVIPLTIADGCLYKCRFCRIKNKKSFSPRTPQDILDQIRDLRNLYSRDILNFNSLFLGEHDALSAPADLILFAAQKAYKEFDFKNAYMSRPRLYMFGSVDGLLNASPDLFEKLNGLPFETCINLGFESADQKTLDRLGKPILVRQVKEAFHRARDINRKYPDLEITGNFVTDPGLPQSHTRAMLDLVRESLPRTTPKGSIYLSPLKFGSPSREMLYDFYRIKAASRLPMFLYIIQRL
ncbi:radical SAM protein [Desulfospira joergensenii]|uniref:radical SAM protein n=1 Tax=Desulfospira joergensenii TaxID=53329 RepID=UPI0003B642C3|nr:radical SAM protein [Desulfospira joergensenii]